MVSNLNMRPLGAKMNIHPDYIILGNTIFIQGMHLYSNRNTQIHNIYVKNKRVMYYDLLNNLPITIWYVSADY